MGKAILIFATAFTIMGSLFLANLRDGMAASDERVADHQYEIVARSAAVAGFQRAKQKLVENFNSAPNSVAGKYGGAVYDVAVSVAGSVAHVVSVGRVTDAKGEVVDYRIDASLERRLIVKQADEPPPFMHYALLSDDDLYINGDLLTDLDVQGDEANKLNANVHTNGNLVIKGNAAEIRGFGTYVGTVTASPLEALATAFTPNYNPNDEPAVAKASRVEMPTFDVAEMLAKAGTYQNMGATSLEGDLSYPGTRENPHVVHVAGDLTFSGNTKIDGYVTFIVDGKIRIEGSVVAGETGYSGPAESSIALYAAQRVELLGTPTVRGQIVAGQEVAFLYGTPRVYGTVNSLGKVDLRGTPNIYYRPASPALTTVFQDPQEDFRLIAYSEW